MNRSINMKVEFKDAKDDDKMGQMGRIQYRAMI